MSSNIANSRSPLWALPLLLGFPVGLALRALEEPVAEPAPVIRVDQWSALASHGALPVPTALRAVLAGGCWLRANLAWERRDEAATLAWIELTVAADERPDCFWLNGARMLAYDMPGWTPGADPVRDEALAQRALALLEKGLRWRGDDPVLLIEMANVHLRRRGDLAQAAYYYRRAAEQPGAPYYAARIHAELLLTADRPAEALAWLRRLLPRLPADDPAARRSVVEARIKALEEMTGR
jgi:hypothetical protein